MYLAIKKLLALLVIIGLVATLQACDDGGSSTAGGGGTFEVLDLTEVESAEGEGAVTNDIDLVAGADTKQSNNEPAEAATSAVPATEAAAATRKKPRGEFHILIDQSLMACVECGLNFDSAELVIDHSAGRFTARQSGSLHIKKGPYRQGRFRADISSIPPEADIHNATLHMRLNQHDGIASSDYSSEYVVKGYVDGNLIHVKNFNIQHDIKGRGYSKGLNPVVPFDYTSYARKL